MLKRLRVKSSRLGDDFAELPELVGQSHTWNIF